MKNNKIFKFLSSMKFSLILLAAIIAACIAGSMVESPLIYFKSWWLISIAALLCINLILCSVSRLPSVITKYKKAEKNKIGAFGSWLTHLGMLFVIVGFALGQFLSTEYVVYGIPGSIQPVSDTGYYLHIDDFEISLRDDYTVEQYTATLTMLDKEGNQQSGEASVNHPMSAFGYELYQDSTGWANYVDVYVNGEYSKTELICAGEYLSPDDRPELQFLFYKFYPDLSRSEDGSYVTVSPICNNPHSVFTIYYKGEIMGMNIIAMDEPIQVNEYTFVMHDPVQYTLIVLKKDPTEALVGIAAIIMLLGIFAAFYLKPVYKKTEMLSEENEPARDGGSEVEINNTDLAFDTTEHMPGIDSSREEFSSGSYDENSYITENKTKENSENEQSDSQ